MSKLEKIRAIVTDCTACEIDGALVDMQTANAITVVGDALSDANRAKFGALHVSRMADIAWKCVS